MHNNISTDYTFNLYNDPMLADFHFWSSGHSWYNFPILDPWRISLIWTTYRSSCVGAGFWVAWFTIRHIARALFLRALLRDGRQTGRYPYVNKMYIVQHIKVHMYVFCTYVSMYFCVVYTCMYWCVYCIRNCSFVELGIEKSRQKEEWRLAISRSWQESQKYMRFVKSYAK